MEEKKIEERQHKIKLSYKNKPLSWRQTTAFLEAKMLKDMVLDDVNEYNGEAIAIDEIIDNTIHTENIYFKNNILDIIKIFPKKSYASLYAWNDDNKDTLKNEISKTIKNDNKKIMDMIQCAHYINSPIRGDLIRFALENNLIPKEILESPDYTNESLKSIKENYNARILHTILPLETIDALLEQNSQNSEENNINNAIKTAYYQTKKDEEDFLIKEILIKEIQSSLSSKLKFTALSLPTKIKLLKIFNTEIAATTNLIEAKKSECSNNFWNKCYLIFFLEFAYVATQKTSPLSSDLICCVTISRIASIFITLGTIGYNHEKSKFLLMFPFYQLYAFYILTKIHLIDLNSNETNETNDIIRDLKNFTQKKNILEKEKQKLEDVIKNEYDLENS